MALTRRAIFKRSPCPGFAGFLEYRTLGKTNEKVPVIGMGTWKIGNPRTPAERAAQLESLKKGLELGMTLIDTAEFYGDGASEQLVSRSNKRQKRLCFIATKVWPSQPALRRCPRGLRREPWAAGRLARWTCTKSTGLTRRFPSERR